MARKSICALLIDMSGSMESIQDETLSGIHEYVDTLAKDFPKTTMILSAFNSIVGTKVLRRGMLQNTKSLDKDEYRPSGMTPLIDAMMDTITAIEEEETRHDNPLIIFVTVTDGYENMSRRHSNSDLKEKIGECTERGWEFVFLGANIDSFYTGRQMGVNASTTRNFRAENIAKTMETVTAATSWALNADTADGGYTSGTFFDNVADNSSTKITKDD